MSTILTCPADQKQLTIVYLYLSSKWHVEQIVHLVSRSIPWSIHSISHSNTNPVETISVNREETSRVRDVTQPGEMGRWTVHCIYCCESCRLRSSSLLHCLCARNIRCGYWKQPLHVRNIHSNDVCIGSYGKSWGNVWNNYRVLWGTYWSLQAVLPSMFQIKLH